MLTIVVNLSIPIMVIETFSHSYSLFYSFNLNISISPYHFLHYLKPPQIDKS